MSPALACPRDHSSSAKPMMAVRSTSSMAPCVVPLMVPRTQVRRVRSRHLATTFAKPRLLARLGAETP